MRDTRAPKMPPSLDRLHLRTMLQLELPGLPAVQELVGAPAGELRARWEALDVEQLEAEIQKYKGALSQVLEELKRLGEWGLKLRDHFVGEHEGCSGSSNQYQSRSAMEPITCRCNLLRCGRCRRFWPAALHHRSAPVYAPAFAASPTAAQLCSPCQVWILGRTMQQAGRRRRGRRASKEWTGGMDRWRSSTLQSGRCGIQIETQGQPLGAGSMLGAGACEAVAAVRSGALQQPSKQGCCIPLF